MGRVLDYPPVWLAIFAGAAWAAGRLWSLPVAPDAGRALVLAGLALMGASGWVMLRGGATVDPTRPPTALVTRGPYRLSRNPIYLADAVILTGLCLIWQPVAALVLVPGFVAVIGRRFIRREEAWLRARDARGFDAWAARTRRWL
ncbi:methyltransferase family protein [Paracoccus alkenifer]|uniref:Protein-S-isoprenylcysteine O-methyltransferase Ste14 n=1 Tax=Paracoccus alkenifer TaxID=65735 RepID=A0A1H6JFI7_9RHOB|nr:isoprenylcysteine carboxylmethyltransferase family protein [Paracoccus alkenifer]SEH57864.1 Protein-S-isoprenylcysteine O-methyltransferase Ste14 [Paracoccus alkenifer]